MKTIRQLHESLRPREEFERRGAAAVSDDILVAILLRTGVPGKNVVELAREILSQLNGFAGLHGATHENILALGIKGIGRVKAVELAAALEIGRRAANQRRDAEPPLVDTAEAAHKLLRPLAEDTLQEIFWALPLNAKNRLIGAPVVVVQGTGNTAALHPRDVFAPVLRLGAAGFICAHNHPSGETAPSDADLALTRRLLDTAVLLNLPLLDHLIVGKASPQNPAGFLSLRNAKLVDFT